jgi:basic membrane protein A
MRMFTWGWAALIGLVMTGCAPQEQKTSGSAATPDGEKRLTVGIVFDSGGRGDKSFNDSAWAGIERAKKEFRIEESAVESKSANDYQTNLAALADKGCELVIAVGINMKASLEKVAPNYPQTKFAIVDAPVEMPNVRSLLFKEEEGSFLAGYLAGLMTKSGKIGFVGGQQLPLIKKFEAGYAAGAKTARRDVTLLPPKYTGSWDNVDAAKATATLLFNDGADVVYHAAGRAGLGVIRAAAEQNKFAIGVDSDQDDIEPGAVLTSMIKRVDEAVFLTIKDLKEGKFAAGSTVYDLAAGGVGLSEMRHTRDKIGPERLAKVEAIAAKIKSGDIKAPSTSDELRAYLATLTP